MSGGGGGPDYAGQAAADDRRKQIARDQLNAQFGVAGSGAGAPDQNSFWHDVVTGSDPEGGTTTQRQFDQAAWDKAQADWAQQQAQVGSNAAAREQLYGTVRQNAFDAGKRGLDEQAGQARRDLKFELFAKGLNGGSVDVDQNAMLGRTYDRGVLDLGAKADQAAADMRAGDETTRLNLLQSINSGMDQGSALSSAIGQMRTNADQAYSKAQGTAVGDLFSGGAAIYNQSVQRRQRQQGQQDFLTQLANMRGTGSTRSGAGGASGTITSTGN